jgi:Endonuclease/Exonuclease/phosphatase family
MARAYASVWKIPGTSSGAQNHRTLATFSASTQSWNQSGYGPLDLRARTASLATMSSRLSFSARAEMTSSDGGRSPVSALVMTVRSKPVSRASTSWLRPADSRARRSSAPRNAADRCGDHRRNHDSVAGGSPRELTPQMVRRLDAAGLAQLLSFSHLDPRPGSPGTGLWARWPLTPLPPVPGLTAAAPRARLDPLAARPVTLTTVHPLAPMGGHAGIWQRELTLLGQAMAAVDEPQVVAGDFNASRDHRPFRNLLAAGFRDCADFSQSRSWPGFTWPAAWGMLPVMRLDHVLVSRTATVRMTRAVRVPHTDHHGVLADIEFT